MPGLQSRLKPNEEEVAAKVLDGEAILINLSNGAYYSTDKRGAFIWSWSRPGTAPRRWPRRSPLATMWDPPRPRPTSTVLSPS